MNTIHIKLTDKSDLLNVQKLWANPSVMRYVGFPEGLQESLDSLEQEWLPWVQRYPQRRHYSVYQDELGYCGEAFYDVDETGLACMDIKLLPEARGRGIASSALSYALDQAFLLGGARRAYVDPDPENLPARKLYERLGFRNTQRPTHLGVPGCPYVYLEVNQEDWIRMHGIRYRDIVLRDMIESDIEDWIRWDSVDTEWMKWDAPDEPTEPIDPDEYRKDLLKFINTPRANEFRNFFELATAEGRHIGRINSYALGEDYAWKSWPETLGEKFTVAIGIDICDSQVWGRGYGTKAITAFAKHFLDNGITEICTQTWSGNARMIRCAKKVGFVEVNRITGNRHIRGEIYDGLTFQLDLDRFHKYLAENA